MNIPIVGRLVDERFLNHRLRSSSLARIAGAILAIALFAYRFFTLHVWSWDLFAVAAMIVATKLGAMVCYRSTQ
jgi:hypothetical protein